jgi:hypothetical protein
MEKQEFYKKDKLSVELLQYVAVRQAMVIELTVFTSQ